MARIKQVGAGLITSNKAESIQDKQEIAPKHGFSYQH